MIVDDHSLVREGLKKALVSIPDFVIIGEAKDGEEMFALFLNDQPDILFLDITLPGMSGMEIAQKVVSAYPAVKIIALTMHNDKRYIKRMLEIGAMGYILKNAPSDEIILAIRAVYEGKKYFTGEVMQMLLDDFARREIGSDRIPDEGLSPRELETLKMIAQGKSTKEIAFDLHLSTKSIEAYRASIMTKLKINTIAGLVKYAIKEGLISLDEN